MTKHYLSKNNVSFCWRLTEERVKYCSLTQDPQAQTKGQRSDYLAVDEQILDGDLSRKLLKQYIRTDKSL